MVSTRVSLSLRIMNGGVEVSDSIPNDLIVEISSRLPAKSVARFRCVSKLWDTMFHRPYFTELFLTRSWARPRLLLALVRDGEWSFFSSPQLQNPYDGKVSVGFDMKLSKDMCPEEFRGFTSGLIHFSGMKISRRKDEDAVDVIFNPTTRQYVSLPQLKRHRYTTRFLGFDPIDKQFKVLSMSYLFHDEGDDHRILTLGTGKMRWRKIKFSLAHDPWPREGICIKGVLYYLTAQTDETNVIVCFDVRSEKFKSIGAECFYEELINYKGKLGGIKREYVGDGNTLELSLWVLEDVEKQEWLKRVYTLSGNAPANPHNVSIAGVTAKGEIVLLKDYTSKSEPFYVFYCNPETNTFRSVEIQGFGEYYHHENLLGVYVFVDYVEDFHVNDAKYLKSSQCLNISTKRPKLPKKSATLLHRRRTNR